MADPTQSLISSIQNISIGAITLSTLLPALLTFAVCLFSMKLILKLVGKVLDKTKKLDGTLQGFIRSAVKISLGFITAMIVADSLGIPMTSVVALVSVAGLALSLSIQKIMSNLFSGITLLVTKPFVADDFVTVAGKSGKIKTVGLFYTIMDSVDNTVISIPNSDVTASAIVNFSAEALRRVDMHFSASYDDRTEDVKNAILSAAQEDERIMKDPAPFAALNAYNDSSIDYVARLWCKNSDYWDVYFRMNERVREIFDERGIEMTYAHMNVHIIDK